MENDGISGSFRFIDPYCQLFSPLPPKICIRFGKPRNIDLVFFIELFVASNLQIFLADSIA